MNLQTPEVPEKVDEMTPGETDLVRQRFQERSSSTAVVPTEGEILTYMPQGEAEALIAARDSYQATLWDRELALSDASARIDELNKTISLLTGFSAELAIAFEQRNQEYQIALRRLAGVLSVPAGAAQLPGATVGLLSDREHSSAPDGDGLAAIMAQVDSLKSDLQVVKREKADVEKRLGARERELSELIAAVDPLSKRMEEFTQENANLAAQLEALSVDAAELQQQLLARQAELDTLIAASADIHTLESQLVTVQARARPGDRRGRRSRCPVDDAAGRTE